jgi:hypothetical protein
MRCPLEPRRRDWAPRFHDSNLLYFCLERIEFLVTQVVMSHSEVHLYHGARQGSNHIPRLHESFVSIDPEWASHEVEFNGIKFIPVFRRD